jgi:hypothetical protein
VQCLAPARNSSSEETDRTGRARPVPISETNPILAYIRINY